MNKQFYILSGPKHNGKKHLNSDFRYMDWNTSPSQTFPKSNKQSRKNKCLSVQICQDPHHLDNVKELKIGHSTTSAIQKTKGTKGQLKPR